MIKTKERKDTDKEEKKDLFKTWTDGYTNISRMCEDSYSTLYKPWIESSGGMFEKAIELSKKGGEPQKYKEFYDEWMKAYQNAFGEYYPMPTLESNKETLEKFMLGAEESNKRYKAWLAESEENARKTRETLQGEPDLEKYKECNDAWMKTYEKIFDETLTLPAMESTKEILEKYTGVPNVYMASFVQMAKLWKNAYAGIYGPWIESMLKLSGKMSEISHGNVSPVAYEEFYSMWMDTYKDTYGKYAQSTGPTKEGLDSFLQSTDIYLKMYKSWLAALEKMAEKTTELSKQTTNPEAAKEFYDLWIQMYEKAFDSFFEDMPLAGPMKEMMEPVKIMAKIYADTFAGMSKMGGGRV